MTVLDPKDSSPNSQLKKARQDSVQTVSEMMRGKANDNTPPVLHWFYKLLVVSLIIFFIIEAISQFL